MVVSCEDVWNTMAQQKEMQTSRKQHQSRASPFAYQCVSQGNEGAVLSEGSTNSMLTNKIRDQILTSAISCLPVLLYSSKNNLYGMLSKSSAFPSYDLFENTYSVMCFKILNK